MKCNRCNGTGIIYKQNKIVCNYCGGDGIQRCDYCGETENVEKSDYKHYYLCNYCEEKYNDITGFCSLYCCITGCCDGSC